MLDFPQPPKSYGHIYLQETDRALPEKLDPNLRYALFSTIATGGKSVIKSCKDLRLSRIVCYKTLRPEFASDPIEQRRFLREARVSAMLQHPNTVPTYELGRDRAGHYYFTMKLVHGYTLREVLNYRERYDLTQLVDVIVQVGYALEYAHSHGVAHRDIKPENILVGPYGEVLLMDWGLAKVWNEDGSSIDEQDAQIQVARKPGVSSNQADLSMTGRGELQGTVSYMSPEQIQRDPNIDLRTDIYSLGAVLYEVLCGKTTSNLEQINQVVEHTLNQDPAKPSSLTNLRIPQIVEDACMRCLHKMPAERFDSMSQVLRLLQEDWHADLI